MKSLGTFLLFLGISAIVSHAQTPTSPSQPQNLANYSIMLVNPAGGSAVVLMHTPQNKLEYVDVTKSKEALASGYVPMRTAEISELLSSLNDEVIRLKAENEKLKNPSSNELNASNCHTMNWLKSATAAQIITCESLYPVANFSSTQPTQSSGNQQAIEEQRRAQVAAEKAARRQQLIQSWIMLQNSTQPKTYNLDVNVKDCARLPALCIR